MCNEMTMNVDYKQYSIELKITYAHNIKKN